MKKIVFYLILSSFVMLSCKRPNPPVTDDTGHVKLYIDNQLIFDKDVEDMHYAELYKTVTFRYAETPSAALAGGISNVPDVHSSNAILSGTPNDIIYACDTTSLCCVQVHSDTGEFTAPDGHPIRHLFGNGGTVTRPAKNKVVAEGGCYEITDPVNPATYTFRLEITTDALP